MPLTLEEQRELEQLESVYGGGSAQTGLDRYGLRSDGTKKGEGFFGELQLPGGGVATEYSIGVQFDGKETEIPSLVPTLTEEEKQLMINDIIPNNKKVPEPIVQKAVDHAKQRMKSGKSPFGTQSRAGEELEEAPIEPGYDRFGEPISGYYPTLSESENQELAALEAKYPEPGQREYKNLVDETARALARGTLNVGSGLLNTLAQAAAPTSIFEPGRLEDLAERARKASQSPDFQPGKDGGVAGFVSNAVGEALPFMAGVIGATITTGPAGGFAVAFAVEGSDAYESAIESGASQPKAEIEGLVVGMINAALEALQVERVLRFAKTGKGSIKALGKAAKAKSLKKLVKAGKEIGQEALKVAVTEGVQEALQETTSTFVPALTGREVQEEGKLKRIAQAGLGGAVVGPILGGAGAVTQAIAEGKTTYSRKDVQDQGVTEQTSAEERQEMFDADKAAVEAEQVEQPPITPEVEIEPQAVAEAVETAPEPVVEPRPPSKGRRTVQQAEIEADLRRQAEIDVAEKAEIIPKPAEIIPEVVEPPAPSKGKAVPLAKAVEAGVPTTAKITPKVKIAKTVKAHKAEILPRKDEILAELDAAIVNAPSKAQARAAELAGEEIKEKLHFEINGGINVFNTIENLRFVRDQVKKLPKTTPLRVKPPFKKGKKVKFREASAIFETLIEKIQGGKTNTALETEINELQGAIPAAEHKQIFDRLKTSERGNRKVLLNAVKVMQNKNFERTDVKAEAFGAKNKGVTLEQFEKDRAAEKAADPLRGKRGKGLRKGQVRTFNTEDFARAARFAAFYFEGGLREVQAWSEQMIKTMGEAARPHLQKLFAEAKKTVEAAEKVEEAPKVEAKPAEPKKPTAREVETTSVIALQMAETLKLHGESLNLGYTPISIQEETDKAIAFVKENPAEAKKISYAKEVGDNLRSNAIRLAYADSIEKSGDMVEYARIANQILAKNRELGQAIVINRGFTGSPIEYVKQVVAAKVNQVGKKLARTGTEKSSAKKVSERIKTEVAKLKDVTESKLTDITKALERIESMEC